MRISDWSSDVCSSDLRLGADVLALCIDQRANDGMFAVVGRVYRHGLMACDACKAAKTRWGVELAEHFETLGFNGFDHRGLFSRRVAGGVRWDSRCGRNRLFLGGLTADRKRGGE